MRFARKTLHINGADRTFIYNPAKNTLADVLRRLGLTGAKIGCNKGLCGACSVILNGELVRSCVKKMKKVDDYAEVLTIEEMKRYDENDKVLYGKSIVRPYALAKACGVVDYGDDVELKMPAETLHVALVQPKIAHHAKIKSIDFSEGEKVPGFVKFITYKDCQGTNRLDPFIPHARCTCQEATNFILCEDKIGYYGDVVALAVAEWRQPFSEDRGYDKIGA